MRTLPPKFLYFDLGNVVLPFDYLIAVRQLAAVAGVSPEVIQEVVFDSGLQTAYERGDMTTKQFFEAFCQRTGKRPDYEALLVASSDMFHLNEAVADLILRLRNAGHRTGVLSNTCEAHWRFCYDRRFPVLRQLFEVAALSYELRAMKPDPAIYRAAAELAGVVPHRDLLCGRSYGTRRGRPRCRIRCRPVHQCGRPEGCPGTTLPTS